MADIAAEEVRRESEKVEVNGTPEITDDVDTKTSHVTANTDDVSIDLDVSKTESDDVIQAEKKEEECPLSDPYSSKESSPADGTTVENAPKTKQSRADKIKDKKTRRKEDKALEAVTKSLASLKSPEEKFNVLLKRYGELHEENKTLTVNSKQNERRAAVAIREKEQLQVEHSKTLLAKSKLESLCRELQKYNREVKEESVTRARLEEERRREIAANFQGSLSDIQDKMNANHETNNALREENLDLQSKLKGLIEQYEKAQTTVDKVFEKNQEMAKELDKNQKEKEVLMLELQQSYKKTELLQAQEKQLRLQLDTYTEKYEEFQTSLQNSNEVFQSFKSEMEKMTKKIKKLEKESLQWKNRADASNKTLINMAEEKAASDKERTMLLLKIKRLEDLCRALQAQRGQPSQTVDDVSRNSEQSEENVDVTDEGKAEEKDEIVKDNFVTEVAEETEKALDTADVNDDVRETVETEAEVVKLPQNEVPLIVS